MNRRTVKTVIGSGGATWGAGCLSIEETGPIDFTLLNFTHDTQQVEVTISDEDGANVLEEAYEIEERLDDRGGRAIREEGFSEATNGDTFGVVLALSDGEPDEGVFRATCNDVDGSDDVFLVEIRETSDSDHTYFEFQQSTCSDGIL